MTSPSRRPPMFECSRVVAGRIRRDGTGYALLEDGSVYRRTWDEAAHAWRWLPDGPAVPDTARAQVEVHLAAQSAA